MRRAVLILTAICLTAFFAGAQAPAQYEGTEPDIEQVYAEFRALTLARMLDLDANQLEAWSDLCRQIAAQKQALVNFELGLVSSQQPAIAVAVNQILMGQPTPPHFWPNLAAARQQYYEALAAYESTITPLLLDALDVLSEEQFFNLDLYEEDFGMLSRRAGQFLLSDRDHNQLVLDILAVRGMPPNEFDANLQGIAGELALRLVEPEDSRFPIVADTIAGLLIEAYDVPFEEATQEWQAYFRLRCADRLGIEVAELAAPLAGEPRWKAAFVTTMENELSATVFEDLAQVLAESEPEEPTALPQTAYVASKDQDPFHHPDCRSAGDIAMENLQHFATREEALAAGHRPCKVCDP